MTQLRQKMLEELQRRNYAHRTAKTYVRIVRDFAEHFHQPPDKLGPEQIRQYQAFLFQTKKLSPASVSQYVSALRFLFIKTLRRHFLTEHIPFPKSPRRLPVVLSPRGGDPDRFGASSSARSVSALELETSSVRPAN
jgi:integrase/recombinase XerD